MWGVGDGPEASGMRGGSGRQDSRPETDECDPIRRWADKAATAEEGGNVFGLTSPGPGNGGGGGDSSRIGNRRKSTGTAGAAGATRPRAARPKSAAAATGYHGGAGSRGGAGVRARPSKSTPGIPVCAGATEALEGQLLNPMDYRQRQQFRQMGGYGAQQDRRKAASARYEAALEEERTLAERIAKGLAPNTYMERTFGAPEEPAAAALASPARAAARHPTGAWATRGEAAVAAAEAAGAARLSRSPKAKKVAGRSGPKGQKGSGSKKQNLVYSHTTGRVAWLPTRQCNHTSECLADRFPL